MGQVGRGSSGSRKCVGRRGSWVSFFEKAVGHRGSWVIGPVGHVGRGSNSLTHLPTVG